LRLVDADAEEAVTAFLRELAAEPEPTRPLPDPQVLLRRARLRERLQAEQRAADRVAGPILVAGLLGPFVAGLVLALQPPAAGAVTAAAGLLTAAVVVLGVRLALIED
jgi:uncharacterized membrane protein